MAIWNGSHSAPSSSAMGVGVGGITSFEGGGVGGGEGEGEGDGGIVPTTKLMMTKNPMIMSFIFG
eukprot:CAMPEP_0201491836 /NCGR_PEP_ID=MMETSP0151_2-20130828/31414_1 /ASSEMBLY_ACC=CAM_ASM_000257 /TAXON_ID=200890 /ORGANISM="Paramoeba atlantica, Strain 621/1 / CCAP 1560/9" /LENGTH=64 /DNA_ID=CAMNT_0047878379 /DNA_START=181 /DNA_END=375 /DNA_ORIENTATION=+